MVIINSDKKKKEIIDKYDMSARFYDSRYSQIQNEKFKILLKNYDIENKTVLDAGCGTGLLFEHIIESIKQKLELKFFYVASDISLNMLKEFDSKIKKGERRTKIKINLILSDLENLPYRKETFDSILAMTSLQNLTSIEIGIKELFYACKVNADLKLAILKKKLKEERLIKLLTPLVDNLKTMNLNHIEDLLIEGKFQG